MFQLRCIIQNILLLSVLICFTGCLGLMYDNEIPPQKPRYYKTDFNRVWLLVINYLDNEGYEISLMDRGSGYISTSYRPMWRSREKIIYKIIKDDEGVVVSIIVHVSNEYLHNGRSYWGSNKRDGRMEQFYFKMLEEKINLK